MRRALTHLDDSADEHVVALVIDPVSHQDFIYHGDEDLVLYRKERHRYSGEQKGSFLPVLGRLCGSP